MATYVNTPPEVPGSALGKAVSRPSKEPSSYLGAILKHIAAQPAHAAKFNLGLLLSTQNPARSIGIARARRKRVLPASEPVSHDQKAFATYIAYCQSVGVTPSYPIEQWNNLHIWDRKDGHAILTAKDQKPVKRTPDLGYSVCPSLAGEPRCTTEEYKRRNTQPIAYDRLFGRTQVSPFLKKQIETCKPTELLTPADFLGMTEFANRTALNIESKYVPTQGRKSAFIRHESRWCETCVDYVAQEHVCPTANHDAHARSWSYYKTAQEVLNNNLYAKYEGPRERERVRFWREADFNSDPCSCILPHKVAYNKSLEGFFVTVRIGTREHEIRFNAEDAMSLPPVVYRSSADLNAMPVAHFSDDEVVYRSLSQVVTAPIAKQSCTHLAQPSSDQLRFWNVVLAEEGLSMGRLDEILSSNYWLDGFATCMMSLCNGYQLCAECGKVLAAEPAEFNPLRGLFRHPKCKTVTASNAPAVQMGDVSRFAEEKGTHSTGRVNTRGSGVDSDWGGWETMWWGGNTMNRNKSSRDVRGKRTFKQEQNHDPHVRSACLYCGDDIWSKEITAFCPDTTHRQMFEKDKENVLFKFWLLCKRHGLEDLVNWRKLWRR